MTAHSNTHVTHTFFTDHIVIELTFNRPSTYTDSHTYIY